MVDVSAIEDRIRQHKYSVGVVGLGYVGLPLALRFAEAGFRVLGFDVDPAKVAELASAHSYIQYIPGARVARMLEAGRFDATDNLRLLGEVDAVLICVPTPLSKHQEPDLQYVEASADAVAEALRPGQLICLESTTYPGTTEEVFLPRVRARGLTVGEDVFLAFSPEREDPGNPNFNTQTIPKVVGGVTETCGELALTLYSEAIDKVVRVSSARVAEAVKILENIYRSVNIAMINELKIVFDAMDIDIWEVIEAARTKPFGFQPFYPGPGLGGHCIPIDPFYLTWKAREYNLTTRFIELAGEVNSAMPAYVLRKTAEALNAAGKALKGSRVLVLGVTYKRDIADLRESPGLEIMELLLKMGADVAYNDPFIPVLPRVRKHNLRMESTPVDSDTLRTFDAVMIVADHSNVDYQEVFNSAALIVDTRNALGARGLRGAHVVKA